LRKRENNKKRRAAFQKTARAYVFRFPKGLFLKSPFGAVWSAQLHKNGVFLFAKLFLLRLYAQKKKRTIVLCLLNGQSRTPVPTVELNVIFARRLLHQSENTIFVL